MQTFCKIKEGVQFGETEEAAVALRLAKMIKMQEHKGIKTINDKSIRKVLALSGAGTVNHKTLYYFNLSIGQTNARKCQWQSHDFS